MSLDIRYSDSLKEGEGYYHDIRYTNDGYGGNGNQTTLTLENTCGNPLSVQFEYKGETYEVPTDKVKVTIKGGIENGDFLRALQTILEAEKITEILGR